MRISTKVRAPVIHEIVALTEQITRSLSGEMSSRDLLVFELHFLHGPSHKQIADCKGINLSKAGVSKLLDRVLNRVRAVASPDKIVA